MENAVNALKMGAAILVFIIAIASSFSLFGTAKRTADVIIAKSDKQAYLSAAELDNGILYTSSSAITGDNEEAPITTEYLPGVTKNGDRVVKVDDVISTIYRYAIENYSVTIIVGDTVLARYDTSLEGYIHNYENLGIDFFENYKDNIAEKISTDYCENPSFPNDKIEDLYRIGTKYASPWLGNNDSINKRINLDIFGEKKEINGLQYQGKGLLDQLTGRTIVEVVNEKDNSKYLGNLVQQYEMPTVEIIYIVID